MYNFIHVPKVAGSSFFNIIEGRGDVTYAGHIQASSIKTMAFVRNPYERLVSAYFYLINGGGNNHIDLAYTEILKKYEDFKDFVLHIKEDGLHETILHIKPMSWFLCDENNKIIVNTIYKIEDIEEIDKFIRALGIEAKLSDIKTNISSHLPYMDYLDDDIIREINEVYTLDFDLFNYKKL